MFGIALTPLIRGRLRGGGRASIGAWRIAAAAAALAAGASAQGLDWLRDPAGGRWYSETGTRMPWTIANDYARTVGAGLVAVRSAGDQSFLEANFFLTPAQRHFHWIGLFQDSTDPGYSEPSSGWKWASGAPITYTNWGPGQPDNAQPGENFARVLGPSGGHAFGGRWLDEIDTTSEGIGEPIDWFIGAGQTVIFNTAGQSILIGNLTINFDPAYPNNPSAEPTTQFVPTGAQFVTDGVVSVRHLYIEEGGVLKIEGPNPFQVLASGDVWIRGRLIADGGSSIGVTTLNTTNIPEPGAPGHAGGGRGGVGSPLTTASSPGGGAGEGAFGVSSGGGQGGETGWSNTAVVERRRGAGGGGGRTGPDIVFSGLQFEQRRIGFDAERGFDNLQGDNGAISGPLGPLGGKVGASPFTDSDGDNNYYGLLRDDSTGTYRLGELARPWAGAGGGGGGDASSVPLGQTWPPTPFNPAGDEKGAGGGGGGGSVHVIAVGAISFGDQGQISARGGFGGGGENTTFLNRVGGGSGGGSGGHVVLETAARIDLRAKAPVNLDNLSTTVPNSPANNWAINVLGGQGGAGAGDLGGAIQSPTGQRETGPTNDACPPGYPMSGPNACRGHVDGAGGDGGPGIIQLHTPTGRVGTNVASSDIVLGAGGASLANVCAPRPLFAQGSNGASPAHFISGAGGALGLFEMDSSDCDANGRPDRYEIALDANLDSDGNGVLDSCESPTYCTSSTSVSGCVASIAGVGGPSASASSGFELIASDVVAQRAGHFFYGLAPQATPWAPNSTSFLCINGATQRLPLGFSGGMPGTCGGEFRIDWNAWRAANPLALGSPFSAGTVIFAQAWFRDPGAPRDTNLSNAVSATLQP